MIKRHFFIIAAAVLVGLMALAAVLRIAFADESGGGGPGGPGGPGGRGGGQLVSQVAVQPREFSDSLQVLGVARGRRSVNITSNTSQLITRVLFQDGQVVAAGTPLVELRAQQEAAGVAEARAAVVEAERDYERYSTLAERGFAPRMMAEQAETALARARANLQAAEVQQGERVIRAPFAGRLGLTTVTAGTLINPGAVITTLDDVAVIRVDFPVPERFAGSLTSGTPITATADAYPGETFSGRIALLDTRVDETTRAITARAEFANPGNRIRPGTLMRVSVQQGRRNAPAAPESAVQYEGEGAFVYRIARGERGSTAQRVEVVTGSVENGFVEITSGVDAGERIVGTGLNRIQPGAPIRVEEGQAAAQPAARAAAPQTAGRPAS
ncbi:MAG: efflux RND transporter periplasmic adaptor subunit [Brevundimonas sp.]|uniref:efflux RND transporter periplasmic adaptor subunit n=1 Tax=Brevundimonas sp. TaxID=1871086 RepID=UPI00391A62D4